MPTTRPHCCGLLPLLHQLFCLVQWVNAINPPLPPPFSYQLSKTRCLLSETSFISSSFHIHVFLSFCLFLFLRFCLVALSAYKQIPLKTFLCHFSNFCQTIMLLILSGFSKTFKQSYYLCDKRIHSTLTSCLAIHVFKSQKHSVFTRPMKIGK